MISRTIHMRFHTMNRLKHLIDVMQAYVDGKTIQYFHVDLGFKVRHPGEPNFNNRWIDVDDEHDFRPDLYNYRIKPEDS